MSQHVDPKRFLQQLRMHSPSNNLADDDWINTSIPEFSLIEPVNIQPVQMTSEVNNATTALTDSTWQDIESVLSSSQTYKQTVDDTVDSGSLNAPNQLVVNSPHLNNYFTLDPEVSCDLLMYQQQASLQTGRAPSTATTTTTAMMPAVVEDLNIMSDLDVGCGDADFYQQRESPNSRTTTPLTRGPTPNSPFDDNMSLYPVNFQHQGQGQPDFGDDLQLVEATMRAEAEGVKTPLIKEELRFRIQRKRKASGLDELVVKEEPAKPEVLTHLDVVRRERRKASNRRAATKCREKKKKEEVKKEEERRELEEENRQLRVEVATLRDQLSSLREQVELHKPCGLC